MATCAPIVTINQPRKSTTLYLYPGENAIMFTTFVLHVLGVICLQARTYLIRLTTNTIGCAKNAIAGTENEVRAPYAPVVVFRFRTRYTLQVFSCVPSVTITSIVSTRTNENNGLNG